ncbi:MAG TPA: thiolase family protein [Rickettsiales bacterium]|nr:thiolase family protein [Rickettsiales bacterium]
MSRSIIAGYVRSPFTFAKKGELARVRPDDLAAQVIKQLLAKTGAKPEGIEDLIMGCAFPEGEQGMNIGRMAVFLSGLPVSVAGSTLNRFCGSSMDAIHIAAGKIALGAGEAFICAGVESMTRVPMGGFNPLPNPGLYASFPQAYDAMGKTAETVAKKYGISRAEQEAFALKSHQKASAASFADEIVPITTKGGVVAKDGCIRADASLEKMATLAPAFDANGTVTAATSSPVSDGAAAVLVCSEAYADKHGLPKLAAIKSIALDGVPPEIMGIGPVTAAQKALTRAGLTLKDMDIIELNEAFAAQSLAVIRDLGLDESRLNLEGGAIAIGHPLGASGARITGKAALLLHRNKAKYALATMCIGGGQGIATVLEKV